MDYKTLFSQYSKLEIDTGLIVPLTKVNKILFGITQDFPILSKLTLINTEIVIEKNKIYYLNLNKFDKYIDLIRNQNERIPYFPYNYYNLFDKESLDYIDLFEPDPAHYRQAYVNKKLSPQWKIEEVFGILIMSFLLL